MDGPPVALRAADCRARVAGLAGRTIVLSLVGLAIASGGRFCLGHLGSHGRVGPSAAGSLAGHTCLGSGIAVGRA